MNYYCNPLNVEYRYQFMKSIQDRCITVSREAADPSMILFQGKYYIFTSMSLGVWISTDLVHWENQKLPMNLPLYDYAPDVRVMGDYVMFSASKRGENCNFYRTKDILNGPYEEIEGTFDFWDPNLFIDDDGRLYFYWGCTNYDPIWGVELNPETMEPLTERKALIEGDTLRNGFERFGENHSKPLADEESVERSYQEFLNMQGAAEEQIPEDVREVIRGMFSNRPYIEGAWMDKHAGKYYLQYACPGTEYNVYADGVYVSDYPLGPFVPAENNPYSYKPGGFITGAGHGSTMKDGYENIWHAATMRISMNHKFERRVGIWPAGFDQEGELFCNQRYGDWPISVEKGQMDPWRNPDWYLLSYGKRVWASSFEEGKSPANAVDEDIRSWWRAASAEPGQWITVDLGENYTVYGIQVNFADDIINVPVPGEFHISSGEARYIDDGEMRTRWILEGSENGQEFFVIEDKSNAISNLPHDFIVMQDGVSLRYVRLTVLEVPYDQKPCISGLRVFGMGDGQKPGQPEFVVKREGDLDMDVVIEKEENALGYNILWGYHPEKLYHSCMVFQDGEKRIGALVKDRGYYVRVDAFNENGITEGMVKKL